tara:strand:+ start:143 stop:574 length:432 start_codon:yes stop_codon:yes gene_type:complete
MTETRYFSGERDERRVLPAILRGAQYLCPSCGERNLFRAFLKIADTCGNCGAELHHHRADDAPPYFTIMIVGHIIVPGALMLERWQQPETWVHWLIWIPLTLALIFMLLPRVKGALVGLQWALRMHGFGEPEDERLFSGQDRR